jgi:hypothetical protein
MLASRNPLAGEVSELANRRRAGNDDVQVLDINTGDRAQAHVVECKPALGETEVKLAGPQALQVVDRPFGRDSRNADVARTVYGTL